MNSIKLELKDNNSLPHHIKLETESSKLLINDDRIHNIVKNIILTKL